MKSRLYRNSVPATKLTKHFVVAAVVEYCDIDLCALTASHLQNLLACFCTSEQVLR